MLKQFQHTIIFVRLLVSVTLEKREGACALFVQKTPDMFTNLPSARKTLRNLTLSWISADAPASSRTLQDWSLPFPAALWSGVFSQLKQVKQTLKHDFASVNLNLLHVGENANTSDLKFSPFAETFNFFG